MRRAYKTGTFARWSRKAGFGKNERDNVDAHELAALQAVARALLELRPRQLEQAVETGELVEIDV